MNLEKGNCQKIELWGGQGRATSRGDWEGDRSLIPKRLGVVPGPPASPSPGAVRNAEPLGTGAPGDLFVH